MDAPLLLKNTGTCLILCDSNGKPLPGQLSLSVSNERPYSDRHGRVRTR